MRVKERMRIALALGKLAIGGELCMEPEVSLVLPHPQLSPVEVKNEAVNGRRLLSARGGQS